MSSKAWRDAHKEEQKACGRAYMKVYREANKEKIQARQKAYRDEHKEKNKASQKAYRDANKEGRKTYNLKRRYNLTPADYDTLLLNQGGLCKICGRECKLHTDHEHSIGYVRGLLCRSCNIMTGRSTPNNPEMLWQAITYLLESEWKQFCITSSTQCDRGCNEQ